MSKYYSLETIRANAYDVTLENGVKHRCIDPDALLDIEPADVRENVRGEWIEKYYASNETGETVFHGMIMCSVCGHIPKVGWLSNYCPFCGADMRSEA